MGDCDFFEKYARCLLEVHWGQYFGRLCIHVPAPSAYLSQELLGCTGDVLESGHEIVESVLDTLRGSARDC